MNTSAYRPLLEFMQGSLSGSWVTATAGGSLVSATVYNYRKRLKLTKTEAGSQVSAQIPLAEPPFRFLVEWGVKTPAIAEVLTLLNATGDAIATLKADSGTASFTIGATTQTEGYYQDYARLFLEVNPTTKTIAAREGGLYTFAADPDFRRFGTPLGYTGKVAAVKVSTTGTATGDVYTDHLLAYQPRVVCIGDSTTGGHAGEGSHPWLIDNEHPYVASSALDISYFALNVGKSSDTTAQMKTRLNTDVIQFSPSHAVFYAGCAAIGVGESLADLKANVTAITASLSAAGAKVVVCECTPCDAWDAPKNAIKAAYNTWLSASLASGTDIQIAEIHDLIARSPGGDVVSATYVYDDIHPNQAGNALIGALTASLINTTLGGHAGLRGGHALKTKAWG